MSLDRRHFLQIAGTVLLSAGAPFQASARPGDSPAGTETPGPVLFREGVASADPTTDSVILWTRAESPGRKQCDLVLQLATHESFDELLLEEKLTARAVVDFTVRARVGELEPGQTYFYRFVADDGSLSRTGRTFTAPGETDESPARLAFASCQNYEQGYFGAWQRMLEEDLKTPPDEQIRFVLHLGDFIYERYRHKPVEGQTFVRRLPSFPHGAKADGKEWAVSLQDYRHLYKVHLRDPHLQAARARWPFICTWDDHEFSNDCFREYSNYEYGVRAEPQRQRAAHQAWFEYIPARVERDKDQLTIFRKLRWGRHVDLLVTDLRSYRTEPPIPEGLSDSLGLPTDAVALVDILDAGKTYANGNPPELLPFGEGTQPNPAREREPGSLMGSRQKAWFKQELKDSRAPWKVWANSLPILPLRLDLGTLPLPDMYDGILSQDAWAGYPGEYRELMSYLEEENIAGLVSLSGDHHMHGAATLATDPSLELSAAVAADFNVAGISSTPHFRNVLHRAGGDQAAFMQLVATETDGTLEPLWNMSLTSGVLASMAYSQTGWNTLAEWLGPNEANPGLSYVDSDANGYGLASFSADLCEVTLVTVQAASLAPTGDAPPGILHQARFTLPLWKPGNNAELEGPRFTGTPPFPFPIG